MPALCNAEANERLTLSSLPPVLGEGKTYSLLLVFLRLASISKNVRFIRIFRRFSLGSMPDLTSKRYSCKSATASSLRDPTGSLFLSFLPLRLMLNVCNTLMIQCFILYVGYSFQALSSDPSEKRLLGRHLLPGGQRSMSDAR